MIQVVGVVTVLVLVLVVNKIVDVPDCLFSLLSTWVLRLEMVDSRWISIILWLLNLGASSSKYLHTRNRERLRDRAWDGYKRISRVSPTRQWYDGSA